MLCSDIAAKKYKIVTLKNFRDLPQIQNLSPQRQFEIEVVGNVLPFKANNYVIEDLIDWNDPEDPVFVLTFPQKDMLSQTHYDLMAEALRSQDSKLIARTALQIRAELNPQPAGQLEYNIPQLKNGTRLKGIQHKYDETVLFFPTQGQTCHAYCTFCFRWAQFVEGDNQKIAMRESDLLVRYLQEHPEVTDVLFTGGDPMVMNSRVFGTYIDALLNADLPNLRTLRIGSKALSYWPYKFVTDPDSKKILEIFRKITRSGIHLSFMAHFNHPAELSTRVAEEAIRAIRSTGAIIRTQSPIMRSINDSADVWAELWTKQVELSCVPYYMFLARDTGAQDFFSVPLSRAHEIFQKACQKVSGMGRTVRGPSMSCTPGKVEVVGTQKVSDEKVFVLRMLQGRNPDWTYRPFFAKYDPTATWIDDLKPAFGDTKFFFEDELEQLCSPDKKHTLPKTLHHQEKVAA